ncbi:Dihydropteridine reductase [Chionoecetes opilio]|uniref:Dihydropteridine reductase n=1 Tax=Chionoecetes opilio TaxID=41210 RepID=A0A8J4Y769_CHIOP|nr:Dihydropteridine reductase [Chionoecetes opilio]
MSAGKVIIYGGRGALGSVIVKHFKANNFWVGTIDLAKSDEADTCVVVNKEDNWAAQTTAWVGTIDLAKSDEADTCVVVNKEDNWAAQTTAVIEGLTAALGGEKVDAIINVAGGWAGGNAASKDFQKSCETMWGQSVWSSTITAQAAALFLKEGGLVTLTGARQLSKAQRYSKVIQYTTSTPAGMIGYGMAKAAVHQLTQSLAQEKSGLPKGSTAVAILPTTLDTPMNRKWMAGADFSTWTTLEFVAE